MLVAMPRANQNNIQNEVAQSCPVNTQKTYLAMKENPKLSIPDLARILGV